MTPYPRMLANESVSWRERAADEVLAAEATGGYGEYALIRSLRAHRPGVCTLKVSGLDFDRYKEFLEKETEGLRNLVSGAHEERGRRGQIVPKLSWHVCRWKDHEVELMVLPDSHREVVVTVGDSQQTLHAFADELIGFCRRPLGRALVYSSGTWRPDPEMDAEIGKSAWDDVVLPEEQKTEIRATIENFFSRREVYRSLGFAWRRGVLLVGPPGTGKTMVCKAAAAALTGLPFLYVRDLSSSYDPEDTLIGDIFSRARELSPCVLVFEDIDGFVNDRNRAVFLGELDGFRDNDGMLVLASSNHPERVDEALLKRPSRFDRVFKIGLPAAPERQRYCLKLLGGLDFLKGENFSDFSSRELAAELAAEVAQSSNGFTPAHLKEAFLGAALEYAHEGEFRSEGDYPRAVLEYVKKLKRYASEARDPSKLAEAREGSSLGFKNG